MALVARSSNSPARSLLELSCRISAPGAFDLWILRSGRRASQAMDGARQDLFRRPSSKRDPGREMDSAGELEPRDGRFRRLQRFDVGRAVASGGDYSEFLAGGRAQRDPAARRALAPGLGKQMEGGHRW